MNTPAHLIFGLTAFGRADSRAVTAGALVGAMIPDASLYLMAGWHLNVIGTPPRVVFRELYYSDAWQAIFRVDNSFILWGILLGLAMAARVPWLVALAGSAILHLAFDFPLHHNDGRAHFWPISTWIFQSPLSYWDPAHHGRIVGLVEMGLVLLACVFLWRRYVGLWMRGLILGLAALQVVPGVLFALIF